VLTAAGHRNLVIRPTLDRVKQPRIEAERGGRGIDVEGPIQLHGPPARVAQYLERLARQDAGELVLAVTVARRAGEDGNDDLGSEAAHHVEHVAQQRVTRPEPQSLVQRLGVPEVIGAREELARAVDAPGREQLLRADDAELGAELGADEVLPAFATAERQVRHLRPHPTREQGDEIRILVIGVRPDHQDALVRPELLQRARQRRDAAGAGWGELPRHRPDGADDAGETNPERVPHYGET